MKKTDDPFKKADKTYKTIVFDKALWEEFKKTTRRNGHKIRDAIAYGMQEYLKIAKK